MKITNAEMKSSMGIVRLSALSGEFSRYELGALCSEKDRKAVEKRREKAMSTVSALGGGNPHEIYFFHMGGLVMPLSTAQ